MAAGHPITLIALLYAFGPVVSVIGVSLAYIFGAESADSREDSK